MSSNTVTSTLAPGEAAQETRVNTQTVGLSVAIGLLCVIGVLLLVIVVVMAITRKQRNNREVILKGSQQIVLIDHFRLLLRPCMLQTILQVLKEPQHHNLPVNN